MTKERDLYDRWSVSCSLMSQYGNNCLMSLIFSCLIPSALLHVKSLR